MAIRSQRRSAAIRLLVVAVLAAGACLAASACGGAGKSADPAIVVGSRSISGPEVAHWINVEAVISLGAPKGPPANGLIPDPPNYTACIGYERGQLRSSPHQTETRMSTDALKNACRKRYEGLRRHVLAILATFLWLRGEGDRRGIHISQKELDDALARIKQEQFHSETAFKNYLRYSGESQADELFILESNLLVTRLEKYVAKHYGAAGAKAIFSDFPRRWKAQTSCAPAYVMFDCKQYRGPEPPEASG